MLPMQASRLFGSIWCRQKTGPDQIAHQVIPTRTRLRCYPGWSMRTVASVLVRMFVELARGDQRGRLVKRANDPPAPSIHRLRYWL